MSGDKPFLFMYSGAADPMESQICGATERVCAFMRGIYPPELLHTVIMPEQPHHESAWEPVFGELLHLFLSR